MSRGLLKGWRRKVSFVAILIVVLSVIDYVWGANSDAMSFAREKLQGSDVLQQRIGKVRSVDLDWLWGFRIKSRYSGDKAKLKLSVSGASGKEHIVIDLEEIDGQWRVINSSKPI